MSEKTAYHFPKEEPVISVATAAVYHFRWPSFGWAIFTVCDETGEFSVQSDWGNWAYRWPASPKNLGAPSLTHFLARTGPDYVVNKLSYGVARSEREDFDEDATKRSWIQRLAAKRKEGRYSKEEARSLRDRINRFFDEVEDTSIDITMYNLDQEMWDFLGDPHESLIFEMSYSLLICRDELLPRFFQYLRDHVVQGG